MALSNQGKGQDILKLGVVDVEYKRQANILNFSILIVNAA